MQLFKKNYVRFGLLMVGVLILCLLGMEIAGNNQSFEKGSFGMIVQMLAPLVVWFLGIRAYKKAKGGFMTWKEGFKEGLRISLVFAIVSPFIFLLYYILVNPMIVEYVKTAYQMPDVSTTAVIVVDMVVQFVSAMIFGAIFSAIIALLLRTKSVPAVPANQ